MPHCGCDFREDRITDSVFQCFPSSPQSVTYHAQLHGTLNANVSGLIAAIEEWVSTGVTIPVQFLPLTVSSVCAVSSSVPLEHCPGEVVTTDPSSVSDSATLVIIAVSVPVAIVITAVTVFIIAILYIQHRHSTFNHKTSANSRVVFSFLLAWHS